MKTAKYLVAKYIPDLMRMEPRNVGVIVWSPGGMCSRFLAERENDGEIDGRSASGVAKNVGTYKAWVRYWKNQCAKELIDGIGECDGISQEDSRCLELLKASATGNYILVDGGMLMDRVEPESLKELTDYLYSMVVKDISEEPRDLTFDEVCEEVVQDSLLTKSKLFRNNYNLSCQVKGNDAEDFVFSHALVNGSAKWLCQRVPFAKAQANTRKNVHDAAWTFEKVTTSGIISIKKTAALVYVSKEQATEKATRQYMSVLASVTQVVNLTDKPAALKELNTVVGEIDPGCNETSDLLNV